METEHLNDNLGQEASDFISQQKELQQWLIKKLQTQVGGWIRYDKTRKERLWVYRRRQYYGKRTDNTN